MNAPTTASSKQGRVTQVTGAVVDVPNPANNAYYYYYNVNFLGWLTD